MIFYSNSMAVILFILIFSFFQSIECRKAPNIIHILADDLGWSELGVHRNGTFLKDVVTPNIDKLIEEESLELTRFYTHKICSPSRCSIQVNYHSLYYNVFSDLEYLVWTQSNTRERAKC